MKLAKNPFAVAFLIGAVTLTILPFMQRLMLSAPPPLADLPAFSLAALEGDGAVTKADLAGKVVLASFVESPCDTACRDNLAFFGRTLTHLSDMQGRVELLTFVAPENESVALEVSKGHASAWHLVQRGPTDSPHWNAFQTAWKQQGRGRAPSFLDKPSIAVIDQTGAVRGFWPANDEGRGHAINAARMFVRHGPNP